MVNAAEVGAEIRLPSPEPCGSVAALGIAVSDESTETKGDSFMNKWLALAIALFFAGEAIAVQEPAGAAEFKACQEAAQKNDWDTVIESCEATLEANPDVFMSNFILGWAYLQKKNWQECGDNYATFLERLGDQKADEQREIATRQAGLCYAQSGDTAKAIPYLQKAAAAKPNDHAVQSVLARSLLRANREAEAEQAFGKVIQLKPDDASAYYFAGNINYRRKESEKTKERLAKYLELEPNGSYAADAHFMLGSTIYSGLDQVEDKASLYPTIKAHMSEFLSAKPDAPQASEAHYVLGWVAAQEDDNETAKTHFETFLRLQPTGPQAEEAKKFLEALNETAN